MISRDHQLAVTRQAKLLGLSRASVYYTPEPVDDTDLALMRRLNELHLELPFAGSRMLRDLLRAEGVAIGREHVRTLMRRMGITAIYQQPKTTQRHRAHPVFPYLLRALRSRNRITCGPRISPTSGPASPAISSSLINVARTAGSALESRTRYTLPHCLNGQPSTPRHSTYPGCITCLNSLDHLFDCCGSQG